jgi:hypothetical protein
MATQFLHGTRTMNVYPLLESELLAMEHSISPTCRVIAKRIRSQTEPLVIGPACTTAAKPATVVSLVPSEPRE